MNKINGWWNLDISFNVLDQTKNFKYLELSYLIIEWERKHLLSSRESPLNFWDFPEE